VQYKRKGAAKAAPFPDRLQMNAGQTNLAINTN